MSRKMSACNKACIFFMLLFSIEYIESKCIFKYNPNLKDSNDVFNIFSGTGPLLYTYNFEHKLEFRHPIIDRDQLCLYYSSDDEKQADARLHLACPGPGQSLHINSNNTLSPTYLTESITTSYAAYTIHRFGPVFWSDLSSLMCTNKPVHAVRFFQNNRHDSRIYTAGFALNAILVLPVYKLIKPSYAEHLMGHVKIVSAINDRPTFTESYEYKDGHFDDYHYINYTQCYDREFQIERFRNIIDDAEITYFSEGNQLVRGHLINKDDLFYNAEQMSIYYNENTFPVWNSISKGNWDLVNNIVRNFTEEIVADLEVYTYPFGDFQVKKEIPHLCSFDGFKTRIPLLLIKVVHSSTNPTVGMAFLTANDPYMTEAKMSQIVDPPRGMALCRKRRNCHIEYPQFLDAKKGVTFCCALNDLGIALNFD